MTGKKDSAVTVLPLTDAVLVLLVLALINVAPVFFAAVNLSWPTGQARHAVPSPRGHMALGVARGVERHMKANGWTRSWTCDF